MPKQYKTALNDYKFVDLFCGIGGFHLALKSFGAKCVFASDIDNEARKIYNANFRLDPKGDIKTIKNTDIPKHEILCGGFPCQSFSISGTQSGFDDEKTGKLFFEIVRIAKHHKPKIILLENVANLDAHDEGKTIKTIITSLEDIGYNVYKQVLSATDYNVPQCRKRIYIIAFLNDLKANNFSFPEKIILKKKLQNILEDSNAEHIKNYIINREYAIRSGYQALEESCKNPYIRIGEIGLGRQGERIYSIKGCASTLSSTGGGLGGRTGIYLINGKIRKLTPRECARLMGFPDKFQVAETANQAYRQFGNSVVVDVVQRIIIEAIKALEGGPT
ncbi:DNA cytosine methyltransferase [Desulfoscipio sp. XC116]|uniref:DNA cytosine methyltransferase n=1 Tax=Desulfoscipio sp. XC116 TaxID=3144975 RepID=UPI00325BBA41